MFDGDHRPPLQQTPMIIRASIVVTMDGSPIENGAVAISGDRIVDVGSFADIKTRNTGETVDLGEQVLLPGLVNAHCHLDYTCLRGKIRPQKSFTEWIGAINTEKSELLPQGYISSIKDGFEEAKRFGTTAIANLTAFPELISQVHPPIRTWWFAELIDIRAPQHANKLIDSAVESLSTARSTACNAVAQPGAAWGLGPHALFTASKHLFQGCEEKAQWEHILLTTHLAESREEMEMFRGASGPLYEFLKSIGRPMDDCGSKTPLELFLHATGRFRSATALQAGEHALSRWIVAHLNELTENDFELLERMNPKFHIVHCPRSHKYFGHSAFAFERLRSLGFNISLGTDSLASNDSLSLFDEMRAFQEEFPSVSAEEIFQMASVNPARALGRGDVLGKIRMGVLADLIAVPLSGVDLFEEIVAFTGEPWMMMAGRVQ
jgi:aminodeoxyfutalosine deaminase